MARAIWWSALLAGASYMLVVLGVYVGPGVVVWKGAGVALLALWAAAQARGTDGWLLAGALGCGAAGDMLLETHGLGTGGAAFAAGHVLAVALYLRNRRLHTSGSQRALSVLLAPLSVAIVAALLMGQAGWWQAAVYTAVVAVMASTAWMSRFSRYRVGLGAMLFLLSDLLIFARSGGALPEEATRLLIWPLYFGGQALIASGAVRVLRTTADAAPHR